MVLSVFILAVFLESLGSLHVFAILGSILLVGGSRRGMLPAFMKFHVASDDKACFIFLIFLTEPRWEFCIKLLPGSFVIPDY